MVVSSAMHKTRGNYSDQACRRRQSTLTARRAAQQRVITVRSLNRRTDEDEVPKSPVSSRDSTRIGIPSKGRMAEDTLALLSACQLKCVKPNPRQYFGQITQFPEMEVWFQRASDVVRKLRTCDLDLGIVGMDMFAEFAAEDEDLVVVHDELNFGHCKLALGIPVGGNFADVTSLDALKSMGWSETRPLRVVTGYTNIASRFFEKHGFEHVSLLSADGALEAAPAMGAADIILDLVSTGVTLRENNLKTITNGDIMQSEGVLVANRRSLLERPDLLPIVHELLERLEAHLVADTFFSVTTNIRSEDPQKFAAQMREKGLGGLQGPTISQVYGESDITYAACICVPKKDLYASVKALRQLGGSGVLVSPMTYIFDEEPPRWNDLLQEIGLDSDPLKN